MPAEQLIHRCWVLDPEGGPAGEDWSYQIAAFFRQGAANTGAGHCAGAARDAGLTNDQKWRYKRCHRCRFLRRQRIGP